MFSKNFIHNPYIYLYMIVHEKEDYDSISFIKPSKCLQQYL